MTKWAGSKGQPAGPIPFAAGVRAYCNEARVEMRNEDGWLFVEVEATDSIIGYAVTVNGKPLPYEPLPDRDKTDEA